MTGKEVDLVVVDELVRDISEGEIADWLHGMASVTKSFGNLSTSADQLSRQFSGLNEAWGDSIYKELAYTTLKSRGPMALELFEDERFPDCKVQVWEITSDKRDPLNPNPSASPVRSYKVTSSQSMDKPFNNLKRAKMEAQMLHERLVKNAIAEATKALPANFGMF